MKDKLGPVFSVIINVLNGQDFLSRAISSVLEQTYGDFELIIWNNGSTDRTADLAESWAVSDPRVHITNCEKTTPLYEARNHALTKARGSFVAFLDADDSWHRDKLKVASETLANFPNAAVFYSNFLIHDTKKTFTLLAYRAELPTGFVANDLSCIYPVAMSSLVIDRRFLFSNRPTFDARLNLLGDFDLVMRLAAVAEFCASNLPLVTYHRSPSSLTFVSRSERASEILLWQENAMNEKLLSKIQIRFCELTLKWDQIIISQDPLHCRVFAIIRILFSLQSPSWARKKLIWWFKNRIVLDRREP